MKFFRLLSCLLLCGFAFTACSSDDDDDDKKPDIRPFPSEGITLTLGMDKLTVEKDINEYVYSHYFEYDYTLDYYLDYDAYYSDGEKGYFHQEVLNEEYKDYFPKTGIEKGSEQVIGGENVFNVLKVRVSLKKQYSKDIEKIKEEISKNPLKVKITYETKD